MKKYLFIALAALGFAACADKNEANGPVQNAEMEESYIAINLMAADNDTRAATDSYGYEDGTDAERAVKTAYFFFFDENGNPFNVTGAPATAPGGGKNHLSLTISDATTPGMPNVSDIKEAVLILNTYKGIYPKQIVAVLNWVPTADKAYTLEELSDTLATIGNDGAGYVMSNSVYMDSSNKMVDAVPLTAANIKTTAKDATDDPINIYVERIAAKVVLTASGKDAENNIFSTKTTSQLVTLGEITATPVYVQLHGWELYNDYATSSLIKNINVAWTIDNIGFNWNDYSFFRCYWAQSQATDLADKFAWKYTDEEMAKNGFQTNYGFAVVTAVDSRTTYTYCGENTREWSEGNDFRTKVILKGQLMQKNGDNYEQLELASWYGNEYAGKDNLKIAVANSLAYTLFSSADGETFSSIKVEDIECVDNIAGLESYQVGFQLSETGKAKTWYKYSSEKGYEVFGDSGVSGDNAAKANAYLATVEPALLYTNGQTYYIVDIKHLGRADSASEYGVVRNHVYQIDIESIKGYGSPVYSGFDYILTPPEYPEDYEDSYVAARINVLSWKVVQQGVDIVQ